MVKRATRPTSSHDVGYEMGYRAAMQLAINIVNTTWVGFEFQTIKEIGAPIKDRTLARLAEKLKHGPIR